MTGKESYQYERDMLGGKSQLSEEDQKLFEAHVGSEEEMAEMNAFIDAVESWSEEDSIKPSKALKASLMAEFKKERKKAAFLWLNSIGAWMFAPQKPLFKKPAFQMVMISACIVLIFMAVEMSNTGQNTLNTTAEDIPEKEETNKERIEKDKISKEEKEVDRREIETSKSTVVDKRGGKAESVNEGEAFLSTLKEGGAGADGAGYNYKLDNTVSVNSSRGGEVTKTDQNQELDMFSVTIEDTKNSETPVPAEGFYLEDQDEIVLEESEESAERMKKEESSDKNDVTDALYYEQSTDVAGNKGRDQNKLSVFKKNKSMNAPVTATTGSTVDRSETEKGLSDVEATGKVTTSSGGLPPVSKSVKLKDSGLDLLNILYTAQ